MNQRPTCNSEYEDKFGLAPLDGAKPPVPTHVGPIVGHSIYDCFARDECIGVKRLTSND